MTVLSQLDEVHNGLQAAIARSRKAVAFTGAGISTECGVPDYRSKDSPWKRLKPIEYNVFVSDEAMRREAWRRKFAMDDLYADARPGRGHFALAKLAEAGRLSALITQNIDDLHQRSGVPDELIIELHGNGTYATCLACGLRHELVDIRRAFERTGAAPQCVRCDGIVKSATISFGQAMPERAMQRARAQSLDCDLFLAIGSSLVVYPAAAFPVLARENGAYLVIINGEETPLDDMADLVLRGDIGDILQPFAS